MPCAKTSECHIPKSFVFRIFGKNAIAGVRPVRLRSSTLLESSSRSRYKHCWRASLQRAIVRITATQIQQWADKTEAQGLLSVLVRRLIRTTSTQTELAIRGADSLNLPGWDGRLNTVAGNAWVPLGHSRWE